MKNMFNCLLLVFISNLSFSQEEKGKNNIEETKVFKFYPNPAENDLFILGTNTIKSIEIIDVFGKRIAIYHFNKSIIKLDVSEFKSGIYLIHAIDEKDKHETKKVVVK